MEQMHLIASFLLVANIASSKARSPVRSILPTFKCREKTAKKVTMVQVEGVRKRSV